MDMNSDDVPQEFSDEPKMSSSSKRKISSSLEYPSKREHFENPDDVKTFISWYAAMCIDHEVQKAGDTISDEEKSIFKELTKDHQDTGLSPSIPYEKDENYENLKKILRKLFATNLDQKSPKTYSYGETTILPRYLMTCTDPQYLEKNVQASEIVKTAEKFRNNGRNRVYDSGSFKFIKPPKPGQPIISNFFERKGFQVREDGQGLLPVVVINLDKDSDWNAIQTQCESLSFALLRGCGKAVGMDFEQFKVRKIAKLDPDQGIDVIRNRPQSGTSNLSMKCDEKKCERNKISTDVQMEYGNTLKEYARHFKDVQEVSSQGFSFLRDSLDKKHYVIKKWMKNMRKVQWLLKDTKKEVNPKVPIISFGTNIDLNEEKFPEQMKEIKKLPEFLLPGNGLMKYMDEKLSGINTVQMYVKMPGSRTPGHFENQCLASINLNLGPSDCLWYCVPMNHMPKLEKLMNSYGALQYTTSCWPAEEDLTKFGIPYQKILQKPDDMVYVGTGTYHYVQSNGYCSNISWNIAPSTFDQLAAMALSNDHCQEHDFTVLLPVVAMLKDISDEKHYAGTELGELVKKLLTSYLAHCKIEYDIIKAKGWALQLTDNSPTVLGWIERCQTESCKNRVIYNIVYLELYEKGYMVKCGYCASNSSNIKCYERFTMKQLMNSYNEVNVPKRSENIEK